jgi:ABC-2 type transport system ATP-binding protein
MISATQTEGLTKHFRKVNALAGLELSVTEGSVHALVGPNGAGKTTLIKILMNIFRASSGRATVLGIDSTKISGEAFATIGYVSENQQLPGWMRVGGFLSYLRPFYPTWDHELEARLVKQFDLPLDRKLKHLSRGMRMKAALASALAFRPKLIVLDEPFSGLDPLVRDELGKALLKRTAESTIFLSSHDLAEIEGFATQVTYLDAGRVRLSEEMASLSARFREVEISMDVSVNVPADLPSAWLNAEASGNKLRFVDSAFNEESTQTEISRRFQPQSVKCSPMTLRAIFLTLAKNGRKPASEEF